MVSQLLKMSKALQPNAPEAPLSSLWKYLLRQMLQNKNDSSKVGVLQASAGV